MKELIHADVERIMLTEPEIQTRVKERKEDYEKVICNDDGTGTDADLLRCLPACRKHRRYQ